MPTHSVQKPSRARLYRPFQGSARKPTRHQLIQLLERLYGPGIPQYPGSPYEGDALNPAELVLHELAHMTQFDFESIVAIGDMEPTWQVMMDGLDEMAKEDADRHEVHAITIVLLVARMLRLPLARELLVKAGARNSALLHGQNSKFDALVRKAERDPEVRAAADQVLALIDRAWSSSQ